MGNIGCLYPNRPADDEDDFSFSSCCNFGSNYLEVLSEEEGDLLCDSDDEYIEIQLQHSKASSINGDAQDNFPYPDLDDDDEDDEHIELRISISSTAVPFPLSASTESEAETSIISSSFVTKTSLNSSRMSGVSTPGFVKSGCPYWGKGVMMGSEENLSELECHGDDTEGRRTRTWNRCRSLQLPAINRLLNALLPSLKVSPDMCQETPASSNPSIITLEMLSTRKNFSRKASSSSRNSTTTNGSIMMKLLVKFKTTQIGTFLTSFMKSRQPVPSPSKSSEGSEEKNRDNEKFQFHTGTPERKETDSEKKIKEKPSVLEINLNGMKGVIETVRYGRKSESSNKKMKKDSNRSSNKKSKSCPTSSKSSPLHSDGKIHLGESCIQAAIAHCKNPFPFFPDFRF